MIIIKCLVLVVLVFSTGALQEQDQDTLEKPGSGTCNPTQNGIVSSKVTAFVDAFNRLRNMVASGNELNHKGKKEAAANMNYLAWSDGLARGAQNCAQKCPIYEGTCSGLVLNWGFVFYSRPILSNNNEWDPRNSLQSMIMNPKWSRQLLWGRATKFGCGRSINKPLVSNAAPVEHIVCFIDEKERGGMEPYVAGTTGAACATGRASGYFALCATAYSHTLLQTKAQQLQEQVVSIIKHQNKHKQKKSKKPEAQQLQDQVMAVIKNQQKQTIYKD